MRLWSPPVHMHYLKSLSLAMETAPEKTRAQIFSVPCSAGTGPPGVTAGGSSSHQEAAPTCLALISDAASTRDWCETLCAMRIHSQASLVELLPYVVRIFC